MGRSAWIAACLLLAVSAVCGAETTVSTTLDECDSRVRDAPSEFDSYSCYWFVARNHGQLNEAARRLESLLQIDEGNPYARLYYGAVLADLGQNVAEEHCRRAAESFSRDGNARGEVYARVTLAIFLQHRSRVAESWQQLELALDRAIDSGEPDLEIQVRTQLAWQKYYARMYGQSWEQLKELERLAFPDGTAAQRLEVLDALAAVSWALGRNGAALEYYHRMIETMAGTDPYRESTIRRNMALVAQGLAAEGRISDAELIEFKRDSVAAAARGGNRLAEAGARLMLASTLDGEEGIEQARLALAIAREVGKHGDICWALWLLAEKEHRRDPEHPQPAFELADEAIELAREGGDAESLAGGMRVRAKLRWSSGPREQAIAETLEALDAIERIRGLQPQGESRARVFGRFAEDYRWFADQFLDLPGGPGPDEIDHALRIVERMRARSLLDTLDAAGATELPPPPVEATVAELRAALQPTQALVSFQGRWAIVVTSERADAVPLAGGSDLERRVRLFLSLLQRRDGSERQGAEQLYRDLLADALDLLPDGITTLILVPDGALHRLPFSALVGPDDGLFVAQRYETFNVPSVATWLRLVRSRVVTAPYPLLALADPAPPGEGDAERLRQLFPSGPEFEPLPGARREALALSRRVGPDSRVVSGHEATESFLKTSDLANYRMLHLATHAVVNDVHPERSAVLLARGAGAEDGLLEFGEVIGLDLNGPLVLLSSCRSGSGPLIGGEGVIGLANAFFQAGAGAVVAGLWPVRDRETAALIDRFGEHLAEGRAVASAMTQARRELIEEGAPPAAWAGMVVLGDGDMEPLGLPDGQARSWPRGPTLAAAALLIGLLVLLLRGAQGLGRSGSAC